MLMSWGLCQVSQLSCRLEMVFHTISAQEPDIGTSPWSLRFPGMALGSKPTRRLWSKAASSSPNLWLHQEANSPTRAPHSFINTIYTSRATPCSKSRKRALFESMCNIKSNKTQHSPAAPGWGWSISWMWLSGRRGMSLDTIYLDSMICRNKSSSS